MPLKNCRGMLGKTIVQYVFCQLSVRELKSYHLTKYMNEDLKNYHLVLEGRITLPAGMGELL